jgi:hypothetical protein
MSFREKSAWITLVTVLVCFGAYFGSILSGAVRARGFETFHLLAICVAALVVLQLALHAIAARLSPAEARAPRDEREALIQARSHTVGYYVLMVMVLLLALPAHFGHPVPDLMNFALLDLVVAALAVAGAQIVMFRRGA